MKSGGRPLDLQPRLVCATALFVHRVSWLLALLSLSCGLGTVQVPAAADAARSPVPPPAPGGSGCVESRALKSFVLALAAQRRSTRAAAIARLGVTERPVASEFVEPAPGGAVGRMYEREGKRFAVVAQLASALPPTLSLGVQGHQVRAFDERPLAHAVPILVCGESRCPRSQAPVLPAVHALGVELAPGEELGAPLRFSYDYWWAQVSYDRRRSCPPEPVEKAALRAGAQ